MMMMMMMMKCLGKKSERGGRKDRISDLPDSVIHQILSSFEMKHVVQTSVLSKRWRYVWKSHPFLNFNSRYFLDEVDDGGFFDFVNKVIHFRDNSCNIQSFLLTYIGGNGDPSDFKTWVLIALISNVEDLCITLYPQYFLRDHLPLESLFTCKSLSKLRLHCRNSGPTVLNLPDLMSLPKLKTLVLQGFRFEYPESMVNNIFSSSCFPVLESLGLFGCIFHKPGGLNISSTRLKRLVIREFLYLYYEIVDFDEEKYPIKLCAPNLSTFVCEDRFLSRDYSIENLFTLTKADIELGTEIYEYDDVPYIDHEESELCSRQMVKFLSAVHNVETLTLRGLSLMAISRDNTVLESASIQFFNLRCLKLETWLSVDCVNSITYLLNISPNLEILFLDRKGSMEPRGSILDEVHWESGLAWHRLKDVEIRGALGFEDELTFLENLLKKALVLESVILYTRKKKRSPYFRPVTKKQREKIVEKLLALPRAASSIKVTVN